jgi:hypothetical protein
MLSDWAPTVALGRGVHAKQPTKAGMRKELIKVSSAAAYLLRSLQDTPTKEFLEIEGGIRIENIGGLYNTLRGISECAARAANSPRISATSTTTKRGSGKALPEGAYSPITFCAVFISEVWKYLFGDYPAPRNRRAAAAADAYWRATGGKTAGWGSDPLVRWRHQFKLARSSVTERCGSRFDAIATNIPVHKRCLARAEINWTQKTVIHCRSAITRPAPKMPEHPLGEARWLTGRNRRRLKILSKRELRTPGTTLASLQSCRRPRSPLTRAILAGTPVSKFAR